jgi:hypothetical protein
MRSTKNLRMESVISRMSLEYDLKIKDFCLREEDSGFCGDLNEKLLISDLEIFS